MGIVDFKDLKIPQETIEISCKLENYSRSLLSQVN